MKATCCDCKRKFILEDKKIQEYAQMTRTFVCDYHPDDGGWKCKECSE